MRDRLVELIGDLPFSTEYERYNSLEWAEHFADYLLANGVIVPPCKVGDTVYVICNYKAQETTVFSMSMDTEDNKYVFYIKAKAIDGTNKTIDGYFVPVFRKFIFGKTVFLTREEAEQALSKSVTDTNSQNATHTKRKRGKRE